MTPFGATRARLDQAIANTQPHLVPVLEAVRDLGLAFMFVPQGDKAFRIPVGATKPTLTIIGDDMHSAHGPGGFHAPSIRRVIRASTAFAVISSAPPIKVYRMTAKTAAVLRTNVLLVETRIEQEFPWVELIRKLAPGRPLVISTIKGGTA